jgi:hypothetical protein
MDRQGGEVMAGIFDAFFRGLLKGATGGGKKRPKSATARVKSAIGKATKPAPKARAKAAPKGHGEYAQEVVGESNYQTALRAIKSTSEKPFHRARLIAEDDNPFDDQAVRVDVAGHTIGYLPRADARRWRQHQKPTTCDAYFADAGAGKPIGVWLRF